MPNRFASWYIWQLWRWWGDLSHRRATKTTPESRRGVTRQRPQQTFTDNFKRKTQSVIQFVLHSRVAHSSDTITHTHTHTRPHANNFFSGEITDRLYSTFRISDHQNHIHFLYLTPNCEYLWPSEPSFRPNALYSFPLVNLSCSVLRTGSGRKNDRPASAPWLLRFCNFWTAGHSELSAWLTRDETKMAIHPWRPLGGKIVATHQGRGHKSSWECQKPTQGSALVLTVRRGLLQGKAKVSLVTTFFGLSIQKCVYTTGARRVCV